MGGSHSSGPDPEKVNWVKQEVASNCVVIFSKTTCPYCRMAKRVFSDIGQQAKVIELNQRSDGTEIQEILTSITGARTVSRNFLTKSCRFELINTIDTIGVI